MVPFLSFFSQLWFATKIPNLQVQVGSTQMSRPKKKISVISYDYILTISIPGGFKHNLSGPMCESQNCGLCGTRQQPFSSTPTKIGQSTVDGRNSAQIPYISHNLQGFSTISGGCFGFLPSTVRRISWPTIPLHLQTSHRDQSDIVWCHPQFEAP